MMEKLEARGQRLAAEKQAEAIARVAERAGEALAAVVSTAQADGVELTGRGLERRLLDEPQLRWIGSLGR
ncbi:MAG: hypothetical protein ACTHM0_15130 [Sphingomonas sp.]